MFVERGLFQAILALAALMLLVLLLSSSRNDHVFPEREALPLVVDIQGEIADPGVRLLGGPCSTLAEVLRAAGVSEEKLRGKSGEESYRRLVCSGQTIHVAYSAAGDLTVRIKPMDAGARLTLGMKLDLNEASEEELCRVPLMKPEFASAIVRRRKQTPWKHLQQVQEISGVGPKTADKWKDYLEVDQHD
jgi:hypothetical protein